MGIMKSLVGSMSVSLTALSTFVFADSVVREPWRTAGNAVTRTGGLWGTGDALDVETTTIQHDSHNRSDTLGRLQCMYVAWQGQQVHSPILTAQRATEQVTFTASATFTNMCESGLSSPSRPWAK